MEGSPLLLQYFSDHHDGDRAILAAVVPRRARFGGGSLGSASAGDSRYGTSWMDRDSIETNTHTHSNNATTQPVAVVGVNHKKKDANVFEHRDLESLGVKDPNRKVRHVRRVVRTCSN